MITVIIDASTSVQTVSRCTNGSLRFIRFFIGSIRFVVFIGSIRIFRFRRFIFFFRFVVFIYRFVIFFRTDIFRFRFLRLGRFDDAKAFVSTKSRWKAAVVGETTHNFETRSSAVARIRNAGTRERSHQRLADLQRKRYMDNKLR